MEAKMTLEESKLAEWAKVIKNSLETTNKSLLFLNERLFEINELLKEPNSNIAELEKEKADLTEMLNLSNEGLKLFKEAEEFTLRLKLE
jgi:hypothetical protein